MDIPSRYLQEYKSKLRTADEAVQLVKSGDWVEYGEFAMQAKDCDAALARRKDELLDVKVRAVCITMVPEIVKVDSSRKHFIFNDWHFSGFSRAIHGDNLCNYVPITYHEGPEMVERYVDCDVAFILTTPMDKNGFFNLGTSNSITAYMAQIAKKVVVEVNQSVPLCLGGSRESIHISDVDCIVESSANTPLFNSPEAPISDVDRKVASIIMEEMEDGACIQLGIGAMPNAVGTMIALSDLKDLGVHTEMLVDSYVDMYNSGRITGKRKSIDIGKMVYTFAMGSSKLYNFLDNNPACASYPVNYTNDPFIIARNDKVFAINNAIEIDLFSQVASESSGIRQISGTGGQLDFIHAAFKSKGGKGFICMSSTKSRPDGSIVSRIKPTLSPGTIVTVPRTIVYYVVTEHGIACLKSLSTWQRAEALISIAHPDFRDSLIKEAEAMRVWVKSNKLESTRF